MRVYSLLITLAAALFLGYGSELSAPYVSLLNSNLNVRIFLPNHFALSACEELVTKNSYCTHKWKIPVETFDSVSNSLGLGTIISSTLIYCDDDRSNIISAFDDWTNPGRTTELFSQYQTVRIPQDRCKRAVTVEAWSRHGALRTGQISGLITIGPDYFVGQVKRLSEFFNRDVLIIATFAYLFIMLMTLALKRGFSDSYDITHLERALPYFLVAGVFATGLAQLVFPTHRLPQIFNRIGGGLSLISIVVPILWIFADHLNQSLQNKSANLEKTIFYSGLLITSVAVTALMTSVSFPIYFFYFNCFVSVFAIYIGFRSQESRWLIPFGLTLSLAAAKIAGFSYLPHTSTPFLYFLFICLYQAFGRIRFSAKIIEIIRRENSINAASDQDRQDAIVKLLSDELKSQRITILRMLHTNDTRVEIYTHSVRDEKVLAYLPPIFAHVATTGLTLYNVSDNSPLVRNIKKSDSINQKYRNSYFSVAPLQNSNEFLGAVAVTDYDSFFSNTAEGRQRLRLLLNTVQSPLGHLLDKQLYNSRDEWLEHVRNCEKWINDQKNSQLPLSQLIPDFTKYLSELLEASICIASLDADTRRFDLLGIIGFNPFVAERLMRGNIFATPENQQGPIALAVNQRKTVIVSNVKLLNDVLHENSILFFEKNGTKSCAAIPIETDSRSEIWGVIWIERGHQKKEITLAAESALKTIGSLLAKEVQLSSTQDLLKATERQLSEFIPTRVLSKIAAKQEVYEPCTGYLLMIDLKGSTQVALTHGTENWQKAISKLLPELEILATQFGLELQTFLWDAFGFTRNAPIQSRSDLEEVQSFAFAAARTIEAWIHADSILALSYANLSANQKSRFCIVYGDVSLGMAGANTKSWTIVGNEMAAVSKLEDLCKKLPGVIFCDESIQKKTLSAEWLDTQRLVAATNRKVFQRPEDWQQIIDPLPHKKSA